MNIKKLIYMTMAMTISISSIFAQEIPQLIFYQGNLADAGGNPVEGTLTMTFSIWDSENGGNKLWMESHPSVALKGGLFSVILGSKNQNAIPLEIFTAKLRFLEITIGSEILSPRQQIVSIPYAYNSTAVAGAANVFPSDGNVGIGTKLPASKLDIIGGDIKIERGGSPRLYLHSRGNGTQLYSIRATNDDDGAGGAKFVIRNDSYHTDVLTVTGGGGATSDRVGIGTTAPETKLDVREGDIKIEYGGSPRLILYSRGNGAQKYSLRATNDDDGAGGSRLIIGNESFNSDILTITGGGGATSDRVGIGTADPQEKLTVRGNILVQSETGANIVKIGAGLDYAEGFYVSDKEKISAGMVLIIDPINSGKLTLSNKPYDHKVAGIVAGAKGLGSGVRLGIDQFDHDVALAGRVYCNVDATNSGVEPGDLLTTSATPGYAMKVTNYNQALGAILGKAMERLAKGRKGQILVLVTLQ